MPSLLVEWARGTIDGIMDVNLSLRSLIEANKSWKDLAEDNMMMYQANSEEYYEAIRILDAGILSKFIAVGSQIQSASDLFRVLQVVQTNWRLEERTQWHHVAGLLRGLPEERHTLVEAALGFDIDIEEDFAEDLFTSFRIRTPQKRKVCGVCIGRKLSYEDDLFSDRELSESSGEDDASDNEVASKSKVNEDNNSSYSNDDKDEEQSEDEFEDEDYGQGDDRALISLGPAEPPVKVVLVSLTANQ